MRAVDTGRRFRLASSEIQKAVAGAHSRHSLGINIVRNLPVFDHLSQTSLHPELEFTDVRVPVSNLLGDEGAGFSIGQAKLGSARLHHCMRPVGECEVLISLMVKRSQSRSTSGTRINECR